MMQAPDEFKFERFADFRCPHCGRRCEGGLLIEDALLLADVTHVRALVIHDQPVCLAFERDTREAEDILHEVGLWPLPGAEALIRKTVS